MKNQILKVVLLLFIGSAFSCVRIPQNKPQWHHPLYIANNDYWRQRIPVSIQNNMDRELLGDPLEIKVGKDRGQVPLAGVLAESIRVTTARGGELLFRVSDSDGNLIEKGPIPENSTITFPVECKANSLTANYIYFNNPSAWAVGDFFKTHREILNGGFEKEAQYGGPLGWESDWPDENHLVECSSGQAHSGDRSIKITVKSDGHINDYGGGGKQPELVFINPVIKLPGKLGFGATQQDLHLLSGATYVLEGWIKAENVVGDAQISIILGDLNSTNFLLGSEKLSAGNGTFDWKKVAIEFTVPKNVNGARIQTLLEGTGTAWFDDILLTCKQDYDITATVLKQEKLNLKEIGKTDKWFDDNTNDQYEWQSRAAIKTINFSDQKSIGKVVRVDIKGILDHLHAEIDKKTAIQVTDGIQAIPYCKMGNYILFNQDIPVSSEQTNYIYFNSGAKTGGNLKVIDVKNLNDLDLGQNLIQNSDFKGLDLSGWKGIDGIGDIKVSTESKDGAASVQMQIAKGDTGKAIGMEQTLPVQTGRLYSFSAWIKCSDVAGHPDFLTGIRQRTLRARFITGNGKAVGEMNSIAVNPNVHIDNGWSELSMFVKVPENADSVKLQLVNPAPGTVWFNRVKFNELNTGETSPLAVERKAAKDIRELTVWQEDPIVKVFQDDLPSKTPLKASISAARNEVEPLQLVIRSPKAYDQLKIKVEAPSDMKGNKLEKPEVGVVGYVPVNYPGGYFTDRVTPCWRQKIPYGNTGSDGRSGMWPDPILPFQSFDLRANLTQPVWIEFRIPKNAVPGDYSGMVQLIHNAKVIKEIPFKVHVWDFGLPDKSHLVVEYDARLNYRTNNNNFFSFGKSENEIMKEIWRVLAAHRLTPDVITPSPTWKMESGQMTADFTGFDKAASYYFDDLKFSRVYTPWYFYLVQWSNIPAERFGEKPYTGEPPYTGVDRGKLRPEFKKAYQSAVRSYWNHMKEKGWSDKVVFYVSDEPHAGTETADQLRAVCDMIHEVDPKIPIYVSTLYYQTEYIGYSDIWGMYPVSERSGHSTLADIKKIKQSGDRLFFSTDGMLDIQSPYMGFERMLPYYCFKYGAEEYEFWGTNWYTLNPYQYGWHSFTGELMTPDDLKSVRYPNGDGYILYPGQPIGVDSLVASIRLKLAREGVEDYEYLYYLDSLITLGRKQGKDIGQAEKALGNAKGLVDITKNQYFPDPHAVLKAREQVGEAIEGLLK